MRCWKCGTFCAESSSIGPYCPSRECDVADAVGLSPEEFETRQAANPWMRKDFVQPLPLTPEDLRELDMLAAEAKSRGRVLMIKMLDDD